MAFLISIIKPIAYISVPFILLRTLSRSSSTCRYYLNVGLYLGALSVVSIWGAAVGIVMFVARQPFDLNYYVARAFYAYTARILSIDVEVEGGREYLDTRPVVLVSNHQSMLDVLVISKMFPRQTSIMAKKELLWSPLGPFMRLAGAIFVDRGKSAKAVQSLTDAGEIMKKQGSSLWVFPEGTRSSSEIPSMLPFKKGAFHIAVQAGIPIVPVVTQNYWQMYHPGVFNHGLIKVKVLAPIPTVGLTTSDVPKLAERVYDEMLVTLRQISSRVVTETELPVSTPTPSTETVPPITDSTDNVNSERVSESSHPPSIVIEAESESQPPLLMQSIYTRRTDGSENGTETEEDEGMVLVGRPGQ